MAKEEDAQRLAKNYVRRLARNITVRQAILTGSRATGSYLEDSDVDLIIVSDDFSKMQLPERLRYLQKQWKSKIPLEAFGYTVNEFATLRQKSTYIKEAVRTGIVLVPAATSADLAGSGKKYAHVSERKRMLDRMRAEDDHQNIDELVGSLLKLKKAGKEPLVLHLNRTAARIVASGRHNSSSHQRRTTS